MEKRYEYKATAMTIGTEGSDALNIYFAEGWEFVSYISSQALYVGYVTVILKRPI